jgi:predicted N-acetyltransferase YhbS
MGRLLTPDVAQPRDQAQVFKLWRQLTRDDDPRHLFREAAERQGDQFERMLTQDFQHAWERTASSGRHGATVRVVRNERKEVVATAAVQPFRRFPVDWGLWQNPRSALISHVIVGPEYRGKKLGQALMQDAIEQCRTAGYKQVFLTCSDKNRPFYQKLGFRPMQGVSALWLQGPLLNHWLLKATGWPNVMKLPL